MNLSAVQFKADKADVAASEQRLVALAAAAAVDADLVVLPEMAATGYLFADEAAATKVAQTARGSLFLALSAVARDAGCWIVAGFPERAEGGLYNSAMVIDRGGALAFVYRKTLLYSADLPWAQVGDSGYRVFDTGAGTFTVGICMDINDDAFVGWCRQERPDVIAFPTNWVHEDGNVWGYWAWRLMPLTSALVAANTYGSESVGEGDDLSTTTFSGESAVLYERTIHAAAPFSGDAIIRATLSFEGPRQATSGDS